MKNYTEKDHNFKLQEVSEIIDISPKKGQDKLPVTINRHYP
jgi:hypothetical protein